VPANQTFLGSLVEADRTALLSVTRERALASGESLFRLGDPGSSFAVLLTGRFKVVSRAGTGRNVLLGLRGPGDLVGEIAILDEGARTADVIAVEAARVAIGSAETLRRVLAERPSAMLALARSLNRRLREADEGRVELAALTGHARVAVRLVQLARRYGQSTADGLIIALPLSQDEIADWTGLSRPAVARALAEFRQAGLVVTARRSLTLPDPDRLQTYADESRPN
jgi:CRP/FNR family transcriptional regulator, cyclic AMP receptor protein